MAANLYIKTVTASESDWTALSSTRMIVDATVIIWRNGTTSTPLSMCINESDPHDITFGVSFELKQFDLSNLKIKGEANFRVTVIGYTA